MIMVSVIIPVYNAEKYLAECLDSVLNQTMQDLEVICINDGSTDNSVYLLQEYQKTDSRVRVLTQENQGPGPARNRGMREACGKYISFLDADDFWHDEYCLEKIINAAEKEACDVIGAFWGQYKNEAYQRAALHYEYFEQGENGRWIDFRDEQNCYNYGSYLFKRGFLLENGFFFPSYHRFEDPPFLMRALTKADSYYVIPIDWYCYRTVYKSALSTAGNAADFVKGVLDVMEIAQKHHLQKLSEEMEGQINAASPYIISGIIQGNAELLSLLNKADKYKADKNEELDPMLFIRDSIYNQCKSIADAFWSRVKCADRLIIYGAGYYGSLLLKQIEKSNAELEIVFAETEYPKAVTVEGRKCLRIDDLAGDKQNSFVVLAVLKQTQPALISNVKRLGFENFICLDMALMTALECTGQDA